MAKVELKNVSKVFPGGIQAVSNLNLEVKDREFLIVVGPSGCGKSTILRLVAGLEEISEGEIHIGDRLVNDIPPRDRDIAMVFQNYALYPHMSVYNNIAFGLKLRKFPKTEIQDRVKEASSMLGIEKLLQRKPKELSGGQRQRVAVGRAIVRKPKVFLFDEPLSNLDAKLRVQMRAEISKLHDSLEATMIYVTHDQTEAMTMGERIVVLKDGIAQQIDAPLALYGNPDNRFVAGFIGSPPMNFIDGRIRKKDGHVYFQEGRFEIRMEGEMTGRLSAYLDREVIFGIRPEDIHDGLLAGRSVPEHTIKAQVEVVQPMGAKVFLFLNTGLNSLTASVDARTRASVGDEAEFIFDMAKAHFFDKDSQEAIS